MSNKDDIIIYDDLVPQKTQQRFLDSVTDTNLHWMDFDETKTAGDYFKGRKYTNDQLKIIPSQCLIKLAYTAAQKLENDEGTIHQPECFFYLGQMILDLFSEKSGIKVKKILRMKMNAQTRNAMFPEFDENCCNDIHTDTEIPHKTLLYYINDADGDTILMNEKFQPAHNIPGAEVNTTVATRVTPKQGRIVCFDGLRYHAPSNPILARKRYLLNINFIPE